MQEKVFARKYNGRAYIRLGNERGRPDADVMDVIGPPEDRSREGSNSGRDSDNDEEESGEDESLPSSDNDSEGEEENDDDESWITEEKEEILSQSS
jgi:hypothetical protein